MRAKKVGFTPLPLRHLTLKNSSPDPKVAGFYPIFRELCGWSRALALTRGGLDADASEIQLRLITGKDAIRSSTCPMPCSNRAIFAPDPNPYPKLRD